MNILIIEDEPLAAEALWALVAHIKPDACLLVTLPSVEESLAWLQQQPEPDLIFSDIHLSDGHSFEIFKQHEVSCPVIFTTAYDKYAIEAFQVNSIAYLLKPVKKTELQAAFDKLDKLWEKAGRAPETESLQQLLQAFTTATNGQPKRRFLVKSGQASKVIPVEEIAYFLAEEGLVYLVHRESRRYVLNYTLDQLQEQLDPHLFFRANRQLIIHIEAVQEIRPYFKGRYYLHLQPDTGEQIISAGKAASFKQWLGA